MGVMEQCWMTLALDDVSAMKAIVLANSLRMVVTTRRVAVIYGRGLSSKMKIALMTTFDQCLKFDGEYEMNGFPVELCAQIYCWSTPFIKKCIFLHPDSLILKNCDELFATTGASALISPTGHIDTSTCLLEPSIENYEKLVEWMKSCKNHEDANQHYAEWIQKNCQFSPLAEEYNFKLCLGDKVAVVDEFSLCIVHFQKKHPLEFNESNEAMETGILEKAVLEYYKKVYNVTGLTGDANFQGPISQSQLDNDQEPIAIIGISSRFPQADTLEEYWDILANGKDCIQKLPPGRWPTATSDEFQVEAGFLKGPVNEFDGKFFGISPAELTHMDPQQRFLLEVSWEALEHAGINPQTLRGTNTGVFVGTWTFDYRDLIKVTATEFSDFHRTYMGNSLGGSGGRLSFLLGLTGPNIATESGCSSGIVAIYLACESLRKRRSEIALAAGANLLLHPFERKHMVNVVSPDGRCKTFDEKADGFGRAEGVATFVLKRYSDALKAGDNVLALIRGYGISQEGLSRSFGTPTKEVQEIAMNTALADAGVLPSDISYVEAHGTGTIVGDPIEFAAISSVYCKDREKPLLVASGKTNIGHTESCSGFAGIIKVILSMQNEMIPPHINLENLNPHIKIGNIPIQIPTVPVKWERTPGKPRLAGVSSFGITGTDAHIIIQEPPNYKAPKLELNLRDRPLHLFSFSAKSESALIDVCNNFADFVEQQGDKVNVADAAFTWNSGRAHFMHRVGVVANNTTDLLKQLKNAPMNGKLVPETKPKLCFLFTGQGSQYEAMARTLYETSPVFRLHFDRCDEILEKSFKISIKPQIWEEGSKQGLLHRTLYSQTSIFCVEYCLMKLWESWGICPDVVVGHSLGEFAAAVCSGILNFEDALELVAMRSRLIEEDAPPGKMIVVKADKSTVESRLHEFLHNNKTYWLDFALENSPEQTVLGGPSEAITGFAEFCTQFNLKTHILEATNAFHTRDMDVILPEYEKVTEKVRKTGTSHCTFISGMKGVACEANDVDSSYWIQHTRDSVNFIKATKTAYENGCRLFLEVGPQPVLCALVLANISSEPVAVYPSIRRKENEWETLLGTMSKLYQAGFDINWEGFDQYCNREKINTLPKYPFSRKKHWYETKENKQGILFNGKSLHPLLGCQIPNATTSTIFQSTLELEKQAYLKDHGIGGRVVFPGAGYLEMCLKAGNISTIGESDDSEDLIYPISIEKLTIEAPLGLADNEPCHMQTIFESAENKVSIYTSCGGRDSIALPGSSTSSSTVKWFRKATATFVPLQAHIMTQLDKLHPSLVDVRARCTRDDINTTEFYEKLGGVGLEFGETFRSLRKLWRNVSDGNEILAEVAYPSLSSSTSSSSTTNVNNSNKPYICHPVIIDALIQVIMIGVNTIKEKLFVPVSFDKLVAFSKLSPSKGLYAYCRWDTNKQSAEERMALLYDEEGKILASLSGVHMIETSSEVILKTLNNQQLQLPSMYEEVWKAKIGPLQKRANLKEMHGGQQSVDMFEDAELKFKMDAQNELTELERASVTRRHKLVYHYILRAFLQLRWSPKIDHQVFTAEELIKKLGIQKSYSLLVLRYLNIFVEEGILIQEEDGEEEGGGGCVGTGTRFNMIKLPPKEAEVDQVIEEIIEDSKEETIDFQVVVKCGENLKDILSGKTSALSVLFPEEKNSHVSAESYYNNCVMLPKFFVAIQEIFRKILVKHSELPDEQRGVLRVLEVGAGTGSSTKIILPVFEELGTSFHYTYTDISPAFFSKAEPMFQTHGKKMQYKVLNIEEDPLAQGFLPNHYDIIFASNVLHATRSLEESLTNIRSMLKTDAILVVFETINPIRDYDVIWALLDGYWRFTDRDLRPCYPMVNAACWKRICQTTGFDSVKEHLCFDERMGIITGKAATQHDHSSFNHISVNDKEKWWLVFSTKERSTKSLKRKLEKVGRKSILISPADKFSQIGDFHFEIRPSVKADMQNIFKIVKEGELGIEGILFMWANEQYDSDHLRRVHAFLFLAQILISDFKGLPRLIVVTEGIIRIDDESAADVSQSTIWGMAKSLRTEHIMHVKSVDLDPDEEDEDVKEEELFTEFWNDDQDFQIAYRQRTRHVARLVTSNFATPLPLPNCDRYSIVLPTSKNISDLKYCPNGKLTPKENQIEVKIYSFGINFRDLLTVLKPTKVFYDLTSLGLEFSGIVISTGANVTKRKVGDKVIGCNFTEGALPSHLCMDEDAVFEMPKDMTFCEAATIPAGFATAYFCLITKAKLSKGETVLIHAGSGGVGLFSIQVAQSVGANIIATAGSRRKRAFLRNLGVKHVFHSRNTDYGHQILEATGGSGVHVVLNSLTSAGFKEASLSACAQNARFIEMSKLNVWTEEEVYKLRPDVNYEIVDLTVVGKSEWQSIWGAVAKYTKEGHLKPIPYVRFECVREALMYMQKAKHLGKIIVSLPEMVMNESRWEPEIKLFNDESTYLITGGLGGIGMEVAKWMCAKGAKYLVLTSRKSPDDRAVKIMNDLNSKGYSVIPMCLDVGDFNECAKLLQNIRDPKLNLPPLRGIMHAAGTLADGTYTTQTLEMYENTFRGKVYGASHLHELTRDYPMEFFSLFSSMVSIFGPVGQSNYTAANAYLDALAHHRHSLGLCAQSVNWGQWSEVGLSKDIKIPALRPFSPSQALAALEVIMRSQKTQVCVLDVDFGVVRKLSANIGSYLEEMKILKDDVKSFDVKISNFWEVYKGESDETKKLDVIKSYISNILRQILKLDDDEAIDDNQKFSEMGMDSLMMLEMKNFIQTMLGKDITMNVSELAELTTVNKLSAHLYGLITAANDKNRDTTDVEREYNYFTPSQKSLIEGDMVLPDCAKACGSPCKRSEIKNVLLTGCTGKLGPYMVEALAKRSLEQVICLIRSKDDVSARDRLIKALAEKNLGEVVDMTKIVCLAGDITAPNFSLAPEKYDVLATTVDAVVHCAVKGNLMEPYKDSEGNASYDLRSVNVIGTRRVLEFAGRGKTKPVLHASTLLACNKVTEDALHEDWCHAQDVYEMPNVGYPISKFICESLTAQAVERGIPVHVHRFPGLLGDKNGCFSFPNNHAMLRLLGFCKLGLMPANPIPLQLLDVDYAAEVSCQLFFNDMAPPQVYNITNPHMCMLQDFPSLAKEFGFHIDVVDYKDFFEKLNKDDEFASLFPYREVDFEGDRFVDFTTSPVALQSWISNPQEFFVSKKLQTVIEDYASSTKHPIAILRRDMQFAKDSGIFANFGILPTGI